MKRNYTFLSILLMCVSFAYGGSLQGIVRDAHTLNPIEGVNVTVHVLPDSIAYPTYTDPDGKYSITGIVPENTLYTVVTHMTGYTMSYTRIDNLGSLDLVYDIFLTADGSIPPGGGTDSSTVLGTIMTPTAGTGPLIPIANAQVRLASGNFQFDIVTNPEGKYSKNIPSGIYSVAVSAEGYNNLTITGVHAETAGATVDAVLRGAASGIHSVDEGSHPGKYVLFDAYPNPFNPSTTISFTLPSRSFVSLKIFNILGSEIAALVSGMLSAGRYTQQWDGENMPSGVYFSRLQIGKYVETKRLVLLK